MELNPARERLVAGWIRSLSQEIHYLFAGWEGGLAAGASEAQRGGGAAERAQWSPLDGFSGNRQMRHLDDEAGLMFPTTTVRAMGFRSLVREPEIADRRNERRGDYRSAPIDPAGPSRGARLPVRNVPCSTYVIARRYMVARHTTSEAMVA